MFVIKNIDKLKSIFTGWKNYVFENEEIELLAKLRATKCAKCEHAFKDKYEVPLPEGKLKEVKGMVCNLCLCPLSTLLRSPREKCKLKKW